MSKPLDLQFPTLRNGATACVLGLAADSVNPAVRAAGTKRWQSQCPDKAVFGVSAFSV